MDLEVGRAYYLEGMERDMWDAPHARFGAPKKLAGIYLGSVVGERSWHLFEVWVGGKEEGVILMNEDDVKKLRIRPVS